ncbi:MAG: ornithine cyclodeaminase family protein [Acidobacteriota bacterium]
MSLFLTEQEVSRLLTMSSAIECVEEALVQLASGHGENLTRRRLHSPNGTLQLLGAALPQAGFMGYKVYTVFQGRAQFRVFLHDSETGKLAAVLEADTLGQIRTGAATGVATRWMARVDSKVVGIIGTGWQARTQLEAVCLVRPPSQILAYSRSSNRLSTFCSKMQEKLGVRCQPARTVDEVVEASDVLITITNSVKPVFSGERLKPGTHINAAGSNFLIKRELDEVCLQRCKSIIVDSKEQAKLECGEFLGPLEKGMLNWDRIRELGEVILARLLPRTSPEDITLFKSLGIGIEDVAVAAKVYRLAQEQKLGIEIAHP